MKKTICLHMRGGRKKYYEYDGRVVRTDLYGLLSTATTVGTASSLEDAIAIAKAHIEEDVVSCDIQ